MKRKFKKVGCVISKDCFVVNLRVGSGMIFVYCIRGVGMWIRIARVVDRVWLMVDVFLIFGKFSFLCDFELFGCVLGLIVEGFF